MLQSGIRLAQSRGSFRYETIELLVPACKLLLGGVKPVAQHMQLLYGSP
jgi:hypothetical protein